MEAKTDEGWTDMKWGTVQDELNDTKVGIHASWRWDQIRKYEDDIYWDKRNIEILKDNVR